MTELSIIIVSYKGYKRLKQCLDSLAAFSGENLETGVIVVNNCPNDDEFRALLQNYPSFQTVENSINGGYGNGCNLGATLASGAFYLILNPDTVVTEAAIIELVNVLKSYPELTAVSCRQVNERGKECVAWGPFPNYNNLTGTMRKIFSSGYESQIKYKEGFPKEIFFPDWISGSIILMRGEDYKKLNGFDEDFWMYFEDVDICRRIRNSGGEIAFCRNITIEHNHGGSSRINIKTASITKTEVFISRHLYIHKHTLGLKRAAIQTFLVINNLLSLILIAAVGVIFFFVSLLFMRTHIFANLAVYYCRCFISGSWISPRSTHSRCSQKKR